MTEEQAMTGDTNSEAAAPVDSTTDTQSAGDHSRQVPLDALQAERSERQKLQDEVQMMKDHLALMQANQKSEAPKPPEDFEGLSEDDVLTVRDFKRALDKKEQQFQMSLQELRMTQAHPDYQEVVTKYLPDVLKNNPSLKGTLTKSQDYELAYYLAKNSESYKKDHKQQRKNSDAEQIIQNAQRAGSLSAVGGTSPISEAKRYKDMSDEEFSKVASKNLGHF